MMNVKRLISLGFTKNVGAELHPDDTDYRTDKNSYFIDVKNSKGDTITCVVEQNSSRDKVNWVIDIIGYDFMEGVKNTADVMRYVEMVKSGELDQDECKGALWSLTEKGKQKA